MRIRQRLLLALFLISGCSDETVSIDLEWDERPPARVCEGVRSGVACDSDEVCQAHEGGAGSCVTNELFVIAKLLRADVDTDIACRQVIRQSDPVRYAIDSAEDQVPLNDVPFDRNYIVAVEFRRFRSGGRVLYYGISDSFTAKANETITVSASTRPIATLGTVPGPLEAPPLSLPSAIRSPELLDDRQYVRSSTIAAELAMNGAETVDISNSPFEDDLCEDLGAEVVRRRFSEIQADSNAIRTLVWDLDAETGQSPCGVNNSCPRRVFVRFLDRNGYPSPAYSEQVIVDTRKPRVVSEVTNLQLLPESTNILVRQNLQERVTRATSGTRARLTFSLDEPVLGEQPDPPSADEPTVIAISPAGETLKLERERASSGFVYSSTTTASSNGEAVRYTLLVTATDRAGNIGTSTITAALIVDGIPPNPPVLDVTPTSNRRPVYVRDPYRSDSRGGFEPYFAVRGLCDELEATGDCVVEAGSTVLVLDGDDPATASRIGVVFADSSGQLQETQLVSGDLPRIYLLVVDQAGNPSSNRAHLVRDVEWTATFAGRKRRFNVRQPTRLRSSAVVPRCSSPEGCRRTRLIGWDRC